MSEEKPPRDYSRRRRPPPSPQVKALILWAVVTVFLLACVVVALRQV